MPAPVPVPVRQAMRRRSEQGATTTELSTAFEVPARTVRDLVRRWRDRPEAGVAPAYVRPAQAPPTHPAYGPAVLLRQEHPGWGAGLIRVYLKRNGVEPLPAERTLNRWFKKAGLGPAPPGRRPRPRPTARPPPTRSGRLTPPRRSPWPTAPGSPGCGSPTSSAARCCTPRFSPSGSGTACPRRSPRRSSARRSPAGAAAGRPGRQRCAVGVRRRPADRAGVVADRAGRRGPPEPAAVPPGQRRGRAVAGHRQAVGRAAHLPGRRRVATPLRGAGCDPARAIPKYPTRRRWPTVVVHPFQR